tara:strand:+ start:79 stop:474 length:396 start_codon:yes stop_codon:yes gene_type:complete
MNVYLAKFEKHNHVSYKIGHTKWPNAMKRFEGDEYNKFDKISILSNIIVQHKEALVARTYAKIIEEMFKCYYPKNFTLEEHFKTDEGYFNKLSGITEMFLHNDEDTLVKEFNKVRDNIWKAFKKQKLQRVA